MPGVRSSHENGDHGAMHGSRRRRPISCLLCRTRKLKCDHARPVCGNCVKRGDVTTCRYVPRKNEARTTATEPKVSSDAAQARIDNLEHLVRSFIKDHHKKHSDTPLDGIHPDRDQHYDRSNVIASVHERHPDARSIPRPTTASLPKSKNVISISAEHGQTMSVDHAHWALLFSEIGDIRNHLEKKNENPHQRRPKPLHGLQQSTADPGPALLFGSTKNIDRVEIISQLPSKYSCDRLIARFFAHLYPPLHILHGPTFQEQYEMFWENSANISMAWVAMLFAMLRIATLDYLREGDEPMEYKGKCLDLAITFRNRFTDCLILADYTLPQEFLIEALILHLYGEYVASRDANSTVWVLLGMIVRLAMRMGYHQPQQPMLRATPFHAEMRRRCWTFIQQCDIIISFQMGLPSMTRLCALEPSLPRNIHDDEHFHEGSTALPPALPDLVPTRISYLIAKAKLAFGFARALDEVTQSPMPEWERILDIDRNLRQIYENIPDHYKLSQLSSNDSLVLVSARFVLLSIFHKALCVVHSRFLERAKSDKRFMYSKRVCLTSAMSILRFQAIQDQKIPVDGQMRSLTNYQTSLAIHDYLLAATVITAVLYSEKLPPNQSNSKETQGIPTRADMLTALRTAAKIFRRSEKFSMEAVQAANILEVMVERFDLRQNGGTSETRQHNVRASDTTSELSYGSSSPHLQRGLIDTPSSMITDPRRNFRHSSQESVPLTTPAPSSCSQHRPADEQDMEEVMQMEAPNQDDYTAWSNPSSTGIDSQLPQLYPQPPAFEPFFGCNSFENHGTVEDQGLDNLDTFDNTSQDWFLSSGPMASLWTMYSAS